MSVSQQRLADLERRTTEFRFFLPTMITGLLQTEEYALRAANGRRGIVLSKLDRQKVLQDRTKRFTFLLTEAALRWRLAEPADMAAQLDKVAMAPIQVIPFAFVVPVCPLNVFTIYDDRLVRSETEAGVSEYTDPRVVAEHRATFDELSGYALKREHAQDFVRSIADEFRSSE